MPFQTCVPLIILSSVHDLSNDELVQINNWLKVNKLSLNVAKTKAMLCHMPQKQFTIFGLNSWF